VSAGIYHIDLLIHCLNFGVRCCSRGSVSIHLFYYWSGFWITSSDFRFVRLLAVDGVCSRGIACHPLFYRQSTF
jgi:hypothetical protein